MPAYDPQLQRLGTTLNRMLERLEDAFARQQRLTSDVSHELRTPLAIIAAEAELALTRVRTAGAYRDTLATILEETRRIDAIIGDLLAAARSEARDDSRGEVDVGAITARGIDRFTTLARERDIVLRADLDGEGIVSGDPAELMRAVDAILHNALKYGRSGGSVQVNVVRRHDVVELSVADGGAGFTPEGLAHALERFWRDDATHSKEGTGLGLAIAEAIVTRAGGTLDLANRSESGGALVVARFPAVRTKRSAAR